MKNLLIFSTLLLIPITANAADIFDYFNSTIDFFNEILDFKSYGIYQLITQAFAKLIIWLTVSYIQMKVFMISFAWDTAKQIIISLNISSLLSQAWSSLDSVILNLITYFKIPEAINIVLSAHLTKYVMRFIGL